MIKKSKIYSCPQCHSLLVLPAEAWLKKIRCTVCDTMMELLDDDWKLSDIVSTVEDKNG